MNEEEIAKVKEQIVSGDAERGHALVTSLGQLAERTDEHQKFMFSIMTFYPQDARDIFAYFDSVGIGFTIVPKEEKP